MIILVVRPKSWKELASWSSVGDSFEFCSVYFWRNMEASPWVMRVIEQGYSLQFTEEPPLAFFTNNQSAFKHQAFISDEIQRLLETGCFCEVERDETHNQCVECC